MVFGLFEGSIELRPDKINFMFGETAEGTLALKLKKPKDARQLLVSIVAERETTRHTTSSRGGTTRQTYTETLFKADNVIDGKKTYMPPASEYRFKIQLPDRNVIPQGPQQVQGSGLVNTLVNTAIAVSAANQKPVKWYLKAALDAPGIDISKKVQISVQ